MKKKTPRLCQELARNTDVKAEKVANNTTHREIIVLQDY